MGKWERNRCKSYNSSLICSSTILPEIKTKFAIGINAETATVTNTAVGLQIAEKKQEYICIHALSCICTYIYIYILLIPPYES